MSPATVTLHQKGTNNHAVFQGPECSMIDAASKPDLKYVCLVVLCAPPVPVSSSQPAMKLRDTHGDLRVI